MLNIEKELMTLKENPNTGFHTEANLITYGSDKRLDIARWNGKRKRGSGIHLTLDEARELFKNADKILEVINDNK